MSECVVRMEMPSKDKKCGMAFDFCGIWFCPVKNQYCHQPDNGETPSWCPIFCQLPEGHGRLGDLDALTRLMLERKQPLVGADSSKDRYRYMQWLADFNAIRDAKTIIPAEAERIATEQV